MASMKTLLKKYELCSDISYYNYIIDSWINGNKTQSKELFLELCKNDRKTFCKLLNSDFYLLVYPEMGYEVVNIFIDKI